jgi:hypothetical protein
MGASRIVAICLAALATAFTVPGATEPRPAPVTVDALMSRFRASPGLSAGFREEKRIALLAKPLPLVSEGTVHYAPPGRLARHTRTPSASSVLLEDGTLRYGDGTKEEKVDLGANPAVRAFVESFLQLLAGDRAALERTFTVELRTPSERWEIVLTPKSAPLSRAVKQMTFEGDAAAVSRMRVVETNGDVAVTTFTGVDAQRRYTPAEIRQVFRLPKNGQGQKGGDQPRAR